MQKFINTKWGFVIIIGILVSYLYFSTFADVLQTGSNRDILTKALLMVWQIWSQVALAIIAIIISQHYSSYTTKLVSLISIFSIITIMIIDVIVMKMANMKFSLFRFYDIIIGSGSFFWTMDTFDSVMILFFIITIILCYIAFWWSFNVYKRRHKLYVIILGIFIWLSYLSTGYLYKLTDSQWQLLINPFFVSINDIISYATKSNTIIQQTTETNLMDYITVSWQWKQPNIILVFAESFSPEYSFHNGWLYNWMPNFDAIQKDWVTFTQYMAPGCVSEHAHTSLLQGIIPISYGDLFSQDGYTAFSANHDTLPNFFTQNNYTSTFISTAPLSFLNQREYLKKVWYQTIIGEEAFSGSQKRAFNAAADEELYNTTLWFINKKQTKPYFLTLQTISSHQPRHSPYGDTVEDTFRYTDEQIGIFYKKLKEQWFFSNWILIILSDHRIRGKPKQEIIEKIWTTRPSKVMATIVWTWFLPNDKNNNLYQTIDFHFWLKQLVSSGNVEIPAFINNPFDINHISRNWWLYYCKYVDNTIWVIQNNEMTSQENVTENIKNFIAKYQEDQFKKNILQESGDNILNNNISWFSWKQKDFLLIGHGWAPEYAPNNSLSWFITAIQQWADWIELDLSYTSDWINIVRHWPHGHEPSDKIENSCYGRTYIPETSYYTIRKECTLPNGEKILTFDELLNLTKNIVPLYIVEIKVYDTEKGTKQFSDALAVAKKHNLLDRIIRTSYDPTIRKIIATQKWTYTARDMYVVNDIPKNKTFMNYDYSMIWFTELKDNKNFKKIKDLKKPIISYTPKTIEDIKFSYNLWISWLLVDNIPLAKQIISNENRLVIE